jgi:hypothetical protein
VHRQCTCTSEGACDSARHLEYFHDHERIEGMFFVGNVEAENRVLQPDSASLD